MAKILIYNNNTKNPSYLPEPCKKIDLPWKFNCSLYGEKIKDIIPDTIYNIRKKSILKNKTFLILIFILKPSNNIPKKEKRIAPNKRKLIIKKDIYLVTVIFL